MPLPRVAIVGRPNVGKSSLMNMLARQRVSIVDDLPGVTRDRVTNVVVLPSPDGAKPDKPVELTDTGGYGVYTAEGQRHDEIGNDLGRLTPEIERQIAEAVADADLVLFVVDCQAGPTPQDEAIAKMLRERRMGSRPLPARPGGAAPIRVVANKCDGEGWEAHGLEFAALGFGEPLMVSAKNNYQRRMFSDELYELLPEPSPEDERVARADLRVAIVGKRNAGKSTLLNKLAGEERVIVSEIPGTTRDAVDIRFDYDGKSVVAIDTAGLRKKKSFQGRVEWFALDRTQRAILRADVVLFMIDATEPVSQVDEQIAMLAQKAYKPCVLVVNKWDLVDGRKGRDGRPITPEAFDRYLREELKGLRDAPIAIMAAKDGLNIKETMDLAFELFEQASTRVSTGELNRLVRGILETRGPTNKLGTQVKVYFVAQVATNPPTIALVVNRPDLFTPNYERFLLNRLHEALPFEEVPIKLIVRARKSRDDRSHDTRDEEVQMIDFAAATPEEAEAEVRRALEADPEQEDILAAMPDDPEAYFDDEDDRG